MSEFYHPFKNCVFLHGCYVPASNNDAGTDAVIACVKDITTGESKLHIIKNPMITDYVLKTGLRTFEHKREYVNMSDCDMYTIPYKNQYRELNRILEDKKSRIDNTPEYTAKKNVEASPYAFGWNISPLVRMKTEYMENTPANPSNLKIAILDIETSVLETDPDAILVLSICDWPTRTVHCFISNDTWLQEDNLDNLLARTIPAYKDFVEGLNDKARKIWDEHPVTPKYHLCRSEKEVIEQAFDCIHKLKPDFLGVWNMEFDIPRIMTRAQYRQIDLVKLFNYPEVPEQFQCVNWKEDITDVQHFTDKWHTVHVPGYTYYYDAQNLYSRIRKVQGREVSYSLDYVGNKIIGSGKMKFGANQSHYLMQTNDKVGYCVYNTLDTVIPALMDAITYDVSTMLALSDNSMLDDFARQTVQLTAQFYKYLKDQRKIPGASAGNIAQEYDGYIGNIGGAVLDPSLMIEKGIKALKETDEKTYIYKFAADLDVSSFYPSMTIAANISRETKLATVLWLEDDMKPPEGSRETMAKENAAYLNSLFSLVPFARENAVYICSKHFGLPTYDNMLDLYRKEQSNN